MIVFFFFQAEDGIRDKLVTGVQTCALPIWFSAKRSVHRPLRGKPAALPRRRAAAEPGRSRARLLSGWRGVPCRHARPRRRRMSRPSRFLNVPYGAWHAREVPPPDPLLTRTDPGTPCGEYLRRFWQPVAFARDLGDVPRRIGIMGEDLVVFRDRSGRVGLLQLQCTHRGTSLEYGILQARGIRCCYHGWVFDVDGRILETPGEPADSTLKQRLCHGAYPTHEFCGLVFAYMGPPDARPVFPMYDTFDVPGLELHPAAQFLLPCNWLQVKDNSMDPVHTSFLHAISSGYHFT